MKILLIELNFMKLFKVELIHGITIFSYQTVALLLYIIYIITMKTTFDFKFFFLLSFQTVWVHINIEVTKEAANLQLLFICNWKKA